MTPVGTAVDRRTRTMSSEVLSQVRQDPRFRSALQAASPPEAWRVQAACLQADPDAFFPTVTDTPDAAVQICQRCPVQGPCLATALTAKECDGVWGATTPEERRVMRRAWDLFAIPSSR